MNASEMSITFSAQDPGTYYVPYTVTQGSVEDTGLARVEVEPVQGDAARPIAANDVALLGAGDTAIVEPLTNDVDPMGGVLAVTSVETPPDSGIKAGVVGNRARVSHRPADSGRTRGGLLHRGQCGGHLAGRHRPAAPGARTRRQRAEGLGHRRGGENGAASSPSTCSTMSHTATAPRSRCCPTCNTTRIPSTDWCSSPGTPSVTRQVIPPARTRSRTR